MAERLCEFESHLGHLRKFQVFEFQILGIFSFYFCSHFVSQISFFISELTQNSSQLADELHAWNSDLWINAMQNNMRVTYVLYVLQYLSLIIRDQQQNPVELLKSYPS